MLLAPGNILPHSPVCFSAGSFLPNFTAAFSSLFAPCCFLVLPLAHQDNGEILQKVFLISRSYCSWILLLLMCTNQEPSQLLHNENAPLVVKGHSPCSLLSQLADVLLHWDVQNMPMGNNYTPLLGNPVCPI